MSGDRVRVVGGGGVARISKAGGGVWMAGAGVVRGGASIPSGRSCVSRIFSAGKSRIVDSSVIVPLSDNVLLAFICKFT